MQLTSKTITVKVFGNFLSIDQNLITAEFEKSANGNLIVHCEFNGFDIEQNEITDFSFTTKEDCDPKYQIPSDKNLIFKLGRKIQKYGYQILNDKNEVVKY